MIIDVIVIGVVDDIVNAHLAAFQLAFIRDCYVLPQHVWNIQDMSYNVQSFRDGAVSENAV